MRPTTGKQINVKLWQCVSRYNTNTKNGGRMGK